MKTGTIVNSLLHAGFSAEPSQQLVDAMEDIVDDRTNPILIKLERIAADLQTNMQANIHKEMVGQIRWTVGAILGTGALVVAVLKFFH